MITILLAAYNGEKYIREQINSILLQTVQDYLLIVCDDCSGDSTYDIAKVYEMNYPDKIVTRRNEKNTGGAKNNFLRMMLDHKDDYIMLCDQDDIWLPNKIERTLMKMREMEVLHGKRTPLLVHTDLCVVDAEKNVISSSLWKAMNADYKRTTLHNLLIQNNITGCTAMYNRALADLIDREPQYTVMHDWWLALLIAAFGRIGHISEQTILYRQHTHNEIGAKDVRTLRYKLDRLLHGGEVRQAIRNTYPQAKNLLTQYADRLSGEHKHLLEEYCEIPHLGKIHRWQRVLRLRTLKYGFARNVAYFLFL